MLNPQERVLCHAYGGILLDKHSYGQLTNFNFDCVTVGIHKKGHNSFNRNWQIAQGSIIANVGEKVEEIHPIIIEGKGHTSLSNVEAFSEANHALTTIPENKSWDYILVRGEEKLTPILQQSFARQFLGRRKWTPGGFPCSMTSGAANTGCITG